MIYAQGGNMNQEAVKMLKKEGYPEKIVGNGGFMAQLCDIQYLNGNEHVGIYRYQGGECVHDLKEAVSMAKPHDEIVIKLWNPCEYDNGKTIEYVGLWFSENEAESENCNACIGYNLYDEDLNEIDGGDYEYQLEATDYWTIEYAIDDVLEAIFDRKGIAYRSISDSIEDFEEGYEPGLD